MNTFEIYKALKIKPTYSNSNISTQYMELNYCKFVIKITDITCFYINNLYLDKM